MQQTQLDEAILVAQRLIQSNALLETVHASLIWLFVQSGQLNSALYQYELCRRLLWQELAVEPAPETQALYDAIKRNKPLPALPVKVEMLPLEFISPETVNFVGRTAELEVLQVSWQSAKVSGG